MDKNIIWLYQSGTRSRTMGDPWQPTCWLQMAYNDDDLCYVMFDIAPHSWHGHKFDIKIFITNSSENRSHFSTTEHCCSRPCCLRCTIVRMHCLAPKFGPGDFLKLTSPRQSMYRAFKEHLRWHRKCRWFGYDFHRIWCAVLLILYNFQIFTLFSQLLTMCSSYDIAMHCG